MRVRASGTNAYVALYLSLILVELAKMDSRKLAEAKRWLLQVERESGNVQACRVAGGLAHTLSDN